MQPAEATEAQMDQADASIDPARWGKLYPLHYQQWKLTSEPTPAGLSKYKRGYDVGEERRDKLDEYPFLALLYNGWGFDNELYGLAREHYEQVFYRLVFVGAENSTGFHNPAEGMRVLEDAANHAAGAETHLRQLLAKAGERVPEMVDLELSKYTSNRGAKKLQFKPEHEVKPPTIMK